MFFLSKFTDVCNFANETTFYASDMDLDSLIKRLEDNSFVALCHLLVFEYKNEDI